MLTCDASLFFDGGSVAGPFSLPEPSVRGQPLDFVLESKHKVPLTNADGSPKELRAPQHRAKMSSSLAGVVRVKRVREE